VSRGLQLYLDFIVFVFGAVLGSFLNVCIHRMPRGESIVSPPSSCPHCGTHIRWYHNIPLVTYLAIGGKCRYCGAKITPRYFVVELLTAIAFLVLWLRFDGWLAPIYWVLFAGFVVATFIDCEHYIIPDEITLGGIVAGVVLSLAYPPLMGKTTAAEAGIQSLLGALCGGAVLYAVVEGGKLLFGKQKIALEPGTQIVIADGKVTIAPDEWLWEDLFYRASDRITFHAVTLQFGGQNFAAVRVAISETQLWVDDQEFDLATIGRVEATSDQICLPREAMGFGDVKLLAAIGAFLGWQATLFTVVFSASFGSLLGVSSIFFRRSQWQGRIPYGPHLVAAAVLWMFTGPAIVNWYLRLLGR